MTHAKKNKTKKRESPTIARQEEINTRLHSAEHLGNVFERQGLLQSNDSVEQPWCFYLNNDYGHLACVFDPNNAADMIFNILKHILYPGIPEMVNAGDAQARDPNEVGMEILMKRQDVWMKYYFESYGLLHKHLESVLEDAMMRLVEELLEAIIPELDGQGDFVFSEPVGEYLRGFRHFSQNRGQGWLAPEERRMLRLQALKSGRPVKRFRRPKGSGWFRSNAEFLIALRESLDSSSRKPTEIWLVKKLNKHPFRQHPKNAKSEEANLDGQRRTFRRWLERVGLKDVKAAIEWYERIKEIENQQGARVLIKRKPGVESVISTTVSYRAIDTATSRKEPFMRSNQKSFDPQDNEFDVDAATAKAALATGAFELVNKLTITRKGRKR